jgi:hypothetical protein
MGAFAIYPFTEAGRVVGARLAEFGVGSAALREAHKVWIKQYLAPNLQKYPGAWIDFHGFASNTGNAASNYNLSVRRIASVEKYIKDFHSTVRVNIRNPRGVDGAIEDNAPPNKEDGYYRAVLVRWFGVPLNIPAPQQLPEPSPRFKRFMAPAGCWCIVAADSVGVPIKAGASAGKVTFKLLNDQGQLYEITGVGAGVGLGANAGPKQFEEVLSRGKKVLDWFKEVGLKAGDIPNIHDKIKELNLTGPSETDGPVLKDFTWSAKLGFKDIVGEGFFVVGMGEGQFMVAGAEVGVIVFGNPFRRVWGFYSSLGLGTLKGALGVGATVYKVTSSSKLKDVVNGASDL